jgi:hypothetical protein
MCLDLKPSIKRVSLWAAKRSAAETQKHETEARKIEDWRGKLWQGAAGVISISSNDSTFVDLVDLIDKRSNDMQAHEEDVIQMMKLAMWCLQIDCKRRPKMSEVVKVLEGTMDAESDIDHSFVATNEVHFGFAGNVNSSAPPVASDISGPR